MRGGRQDGTPGAAAATPGTGGSALARAGAKRGRPDDADAGAAATPLLGSGWDGAADGAVAAKRLRPSERRPWRAGASSLQPRGLPEAASSSAPAAEPVSTNAARRILMALETMTQVGMHAAVGCKHILAWEQPSTLHNQVRLVCRLA